jgi:putative transposase
MSLPYVSYMAYRSILANKYYHVYNRGTLAMDLFRDRRDYNKFLIKLSHVCGAYEIETVAYCLMPNHFHLLLREPEQNISGKRSSIAALMQSLQNSYTKHFAYKYQHSGVVFQGAYKSKFIPDDEYFDTLIEYILDNPVKKKLVLKSEYWPYSGRDKIMIMK